MDGDAAAAFFESFFSDWSKQLDASLADVRRLEAQRNADVLPQDVQPHVDLWNELGSAKAKAIEGDVLYMAAGLWQTPFERAFSWLGGVRPTIMFQLIYSQIGAQTSRSLAALLEGEESSSLASLTSSQLTTLSSLQERTIRLEEQLSTQLAEVQTTMPVLPLPPGVADNLSRQDSGTGSSGSTGDSDEVAMPDPDVRRKVALMDDATRRLQSLKRLLLDADRLRVETRRQLCALLAPAQALQFYKGLGELWQAQRALGEALDCG
ncbi:Putative DOG1 domain-containing protein [Klebsormidium nitens]|uniref:Putative DOG1 domain-containing protein n=1 Tax=Klebsormidium nitens TaxID=105231 RepID=A0A1Y1I4E5_KLENI|nr:Putative DOG1 domain-containing protein [Klebsormidium nitens]|eukprot:GAQ83596.1 Putative DOG1 domain-containing protein [Klebsormidium nitens]